MSDQPTTFSDDSGVRFTIDAARGWGKPEHLYIELADTTEQCKISQFIPTARLLGMIDAADPDAMRAYLRETVEQTYLENMGMPPVEREIPAGLPVKVTPERLDAVPEADSPEDVDERPEVDQARAAGDLADLREAGRALGEAWREFRDAVRAGADR